MLERNRRELSNLCPHGRMTDSLYFVLIQNATKIETGLN